MLTRTDQAKSSLPAGLRRNRTYNLFPADANSPIHVVSPGIAYYLGLNSVTVTTLWDHTSASFNANAALDFWLWGAADPFFSDELDILIASPTPANPVVQLYFSAPLPVVGLNGEPGGFYMGVYTPPSFMTACRVSFDWHRIPDNEWKSADYGDTAPIYP